MNQESFIEIKDVYYSYEGEEDGVKLPPVIKGISLTVRRGEFLAILGHNGSGKSTLTRLCNAMAIPDRGKVFVDGLDTSDESKEYDIRKKVGVVMQNPDNQIVASIVEEDVAFGPENLGVPPLEIRDRVDDALKKVGMYAYRNHEPHKLSGGQKQRVAIAGVIAMRTDCIILDEPTAMLDPSGRKEVFSTVRSLNKELGVTVIYITHNMDEAVRADRVIVMDSGEILLSGKPADVFSQTDLLKKAGLDIPQSAKLAQRLRDMGIALPNGILTPEDFISSFISYAGGCK